MPIKSEDCVHALTQEISLNWGKYRHLITYELPEYSQVHYQCEPYKSMGASYGFFTASDPRHWKRISKRKDKATGLFHREFCNIYCSANVNAFPPKNIGDLVSMSRRLIADVVDDGQTIHSITFRIA